MSGFIFIIVLDWVMKRTVEELKTKWNTMRLQHRSQMSYICRRHRTVFNHLVSHAKENIEKTSNAAYVGLKMGAKKTKVVRVNARRRDSVKISR